ncbi:MAG: hypothetical protein KJ698_02115 [Actinobacteria bacterium]|jgi:hypothetical protein|nr:hypothetical protein [Actinomycetota bacterium]MBU1492959.1 hypothetical protein [Actinomycetota bacterium]MBU1865895.1 hypothetical protein [Actinomycetota bacterium]
MKEHPGTFVFGLVFVLFGVGYLLDLSGVWDIRPLRLWPVTLIAIGAVIVLTARNSEGDG